MKKCILSFILTVIFCDFAGAAVVELDKSFNNTGYVEYNNTPCYGVAVKIDSQDRIVVSGRINNSDLAVWRYYENGVIDTSFGTGGLVTHDNAAGGDGNDWGYGMVIDSSDRIVIGGRSWNGTNYDMVVWRFTANGALDTSFAAGMGYVVIDLTNDECGTDIEIDNNGKIVVFGHSKNTNVNPALANIIIWRFYNNGTPDTTFGSGSGYVSYSNNANEGRWRDLGHEWPGEIDSSGRLVMAASRYNGSNDDIMVVRFNANGLIDTSFGIGGTVTHDNAAGGNGDDWSRGMMIDPDGKILITGMSTKSGGGMDAVVWRFSDNGTLDATFNGKGYLVFDFPGNGFGGGIKKLDLESGERLVICGGTDFMNSDGILMYYTLEGELDTTFGETGYTIYEHPGGHDVFMSLELDTHGRILVTSMYGGYGGDPYSYTMRLYRYTFDDLYTSLPDLSGGEIKIIGGRESKGAVNPDKGEKVKIDFKGTEIGEFTCKIFTLTGELVFEETKSDLKEERFSWIPEDFATGIYIVYVEGPGTKIYKKVAITR